MRTARTSPLSSLLTYLCLALLVTGCTLTAEILDSSSELDSITPDEGLVFNKAHLDFSDLRGDIYDVQTDSGGNIQVQLNLQEYVYRNKLRFKNIPADAELVCSGTDGNLAISAIDLSGTREIKFLYGYWTPDTQALADKQAQVQSFSCHLEAAGEQSNTIVFNLSLNESEVIRASVPAYTEIETYGSGYSPVVSGNGRYVAFLSVMDFTADDVNGVPDVYVWDRDTGKVVRASLSSSGEGANDTSLSPSISADGRYVVFSSYASNLVANDTNDSRDVFIHDLQTRETKIVSANSSGTIGDEYSGSPVISKDGRFVVFESEATNLDPADVNGEQDIYIYARETGQVTLVSVNNAGALADSDSEGASVSADGRFVVFTSYASNLVAGDGNDQSDIFVRDLQTSQTTRVSVSSGAVEGDMYSYEATISDDGRYVAFTSGATNLVAGDGNWDTDIFLHDRQTSQTTRVSAAPAGVDGDGYATSPSLSSDGRYVLFYSRASNLIAGDTNGVSDIFRYDRGSGTTVRVSLTTAGAQPSTGSSSPSLSGDGQSLVYHRADQIYYHDLNIAEITEVAIGIPGVDNDGVSEAPSISGDGRYVAFQSSATNLVAGDTNGVTDIFVHDRQLATTVRVSVSSAGVQANGQSLNPKISLDGRYVVFSSDATNLVAGDGNAVGDIFVYDRQTAQTSRVSISSAAAEADGASYTPSVSGDGRYVAFQSWAGNLVAGDTNSTADIFVHDRQTGNTVRASVSTAGTQGNAVSTFPVISADGQYVAFESSATNLVVDTGFFKDIFVRDLQLSQTTRVNVSSAGVQANALASNPSISGDGRYVVFESGATNLVAGDTNNRRDVFVHDRQTAQTTRISVGPAGVQGTQHSGVPAISNDGRYVSFESEAPGLVASDTNGVPDVFVHDLLTGLNLRLESVAKGNGSNEVFQTSISSDGKYVALQSASHLIFPGDNNDGSRDIFISKVPYP